MAATVQKRTHGAGLRPVAALAIGFIWSEAHERWGDCVVTTTKHSAAVVGGALRDTFDGRTYDWKADDGAIETRERKAMSVWRVAR